MWFSFYRLVQCLHAIGKTYLLGHRQKARNMATDVSVPRWQGLRVILGVRPSTFNTMVPRLLKPPLTSSHITALGSLAQVAGACGCTASPTRFSAATSGICFCARTCAVLYYRARTAA